jgi:hypothetical protein
MTCYAATYEERFRQVLKSLHWLNYADRDKISAVDQLILTTSSKSIRLMRTSVYYIFNLDYY